MQKKVFIHWLLYRPQYLIFYDLHMTKAWTWHRMDLIKCHAVAQTFDLTYFSSSMHFIKWWGVHFFHCENPNKILCISICRGADVVNRNGIFLKKKKNGVNNCGFVETKWRQNKTFRCTLREFYHQLIKEKKLKRKTKNYNIETVIDNSVVFTHD